VERYSLIRMGDDILHKTILTIQNREIPLIRLSAAVVGSGCAGLNAADWLYDLGVRDAAVITEGVNMGTSRNTGSDKQTYYKLSLASDGEDSVARLAADLFASPGVNGDTAYAEAACSVRSFIKLANLGVPFPTNEYGEYVGYKTDHDPRQRATSAGPLTSRFMTEALERSVRAKNVTILDGLIAVEILVKDNEVKGLVCVDKNSLGNGCSGLTLVCAENVILATGGPAAVYENRVYPESQTGMTGMALLAGAKAANLHEWQYGLASVKFRWNVSGTYQQVLPRYISVGETGEEREFLPGYFGSPQKALDMVFLKGYQWPFDTRKLGGSSVVDLIVHNEIFGLNRKVYMDFRADPAGLEDGFGGLAPETKEYLANSGALVKTPIARLLRMNAPAVELYLNNGIDLRAEPLEVSVCAQHHNGGLAVDADWRTSIAGLYAAGEAAGTFGVYRPGGSALNSTQVGSMRAAEHIAYRRKTGVTERAFAELAVPSAEAWLARLGRLARLESGRAVKNGSENRGSGDKTAFSRDMSSFASYIRDADKMKRLADSIRRELDGFWENAPACAAGDIPGVVKARDAMITQLAVLSAMIKSAEIAGTRGSALVLGRDGEAVSPALPGFAYAPEKPLGDNCVLTTQLSGGRFVSSYEPVRPMPRPSGWFETVWKEFQERTAGAGL